MHRSTISLLAIASSVLGSPLQYRNSSSTCSEDSLGGFEWTVESFAFTASYIFTTPAHQNSWGFANFNLSNPAVPDVLATCSAQSNQLSDFFYGNQVFHCTVDDKEGPAPATFTYNKASGELAINQTWTCDDVDPKYPTTFSAAGTANLTLDCTDTTWQNGNWSLGQIYSDRSIDCTPVTVDVEPYEISAVA
ncbi:hypothetical protein SLS53_001134 [Cytospora paraplurivora]|uniref:AA1-like domain-containing protein n=1 Tax=Cytospora paraplurivora TaxID=2898453 RepID=A0AAN9UJ99_9PEZI